MKGTFFSSVKNGAQKGLIYGDNAAVVASWPFILLNVIAVGVIRGDEDWRFDDLNPSIYAHKALAIPFKIPSTLIGAFIGAMASATNTPLDKPIDKYGYDMRPELTVKR